LARAASELRPQKKAREATEDLSTAPEVVVNHSFMSLNNCEMINKENNLLIQSHQPGEVLCAILASSLLYQNPILLQVCALHDLTMKPPGFPDFQILVL